MYAKAKSNCLGKYAPALVEESTPAGCELRAEATASEIAPPPPRGRPLSARSRRPAATASSTVSASLGSSATSSSGLKFVFALRDEPTEHDESTQECVSK